MRTLKFLSALQRKIGDTKEPIERGLMSVDAWVNQRAVKSTMVDFGATHNFITETEARQLNLRWERDTGKMKVVNSAALPITGVAKRVVVKLGEWSGPADFLIFKKDDFDVVLGMEFLLEHKVIPMSLAKCLVITRSTPTVVQTNIKQPNGVKMITALQLKKGLAHDEPTFMAILVESVKTEGETAPKAIQFVLEECLPKSLPSRRGINYEIELLLGAKPPAKNAYWMAPPELAELRK